MELKIPHNCLCLAPLFPTCIINCLAKFIMYFIFVFLQVTRTIDKVVLNLWRRDVPPMVNVRKMKSAVCLRERNPVFLHVQLWIVDLAVFVLLEIMLPNVHVLQVRIFQIYFVCIYFCKMKEPIVLNWNNELIKSTQYKKLAPNTLRFLY